MLSTVDVLKGDRKALRRAVSVPCEIESDTFDAKISLELSDLSPYGAFVDTPLALELGDEVVVSFTPPNSTGLFVLRARVARAGLFRRQRDRHPVGIGLEFQDLGPSEHRALSQALVGIPPRLPRVACATDGGTMAARTSLVQRELVWVDALVSFEEELDDRSNVFETFEPLGFDVDELSFTCAGELVTGTRPTYVFAS